MTCIVDAKDTDSCARNDRWRDRSGGAGEGEVCGEGD